MACRLIDPAASAEAAYLACYHSTSGTAERVTLGSLTEGDVVLTASADGTLMFDVVLVNQHITDGASARMLMVRSAAHTLEALRSLPCCPAWL